MKVISLNEYNPEIFVRHNCNSKKKPIEPKKVLKQPLNTIKSLRNEMKNRKYEISTDMIQPLKQFCCWAVKTTTLNPKLIEFFQQYKS